MEELSALAGLGEIEPDPDRPTGVGNRIRALWQLRRIGRTGIDVLSETVYLRPRPDAAHAFHAITGLRL